MQAWVLFVACGGTVTPSDTEPSGMEDVSQTDEETDEATDTETVETLTDFREQGSESFSRTTGSATLDSDCTMSWTAYEVEGADSTVLLSHGFARGSTNVDGWARHLASWGVNVVVPDLCHAAIWDTNHEANGEELQLLADEVGADAPIYVGHSAGGLASLLAAAEDGDALGVVGLDLTDSEDLGLEAARGLTVPAFGLAGDPGDCNADGNGVDAVEAADDAVVALLRGADHCHFEDETDSLCTAFCAGDGGGFDDDTHREAIAALTTAAVLSLAGLDGRAQQDWWTEDGEGLALLDEGHVLLR